MNILISIDLNHRSSQHAFPTAILPPVFTLFHVARYNGATKGRIFDGVAYNWVSGFVSANSGVAYHGFTFITPIVDSHGTNWVMSSDQNARYRSNRVERTIPGVVPGSPSHDQLSINYGWAGDGQPSDWAVAEILVFNKALTTDEMVAVEHYLSGKYGV